MHLTREFLRGLLIILLVVAFGVWVITYSIRTAEFPVRMTVKWVLTLLVGGVVGVAIHLLSPITPFIIVFCAIILSYLWTPHLGGLLSKPLTNIFDGGDIPPEPQPAYSAAISKVK